MAVPADAVPGTSAGRFWDPAKPLATDPAVLERARDGELYYGAGELAVDVLRGKYLAPTERGPRDVWERVSRAIASTEADPEPWARRFFDLLYDFRFVPGGRVMHGAGRHDTRRKPTLSNCYVIPIEEDSLEGIYRCIYESAMVYRTGGGVGTDLSILRPANAPVNATVAGSPGATSFMNLFSESTNTVSQAGRRGALMLTMRVDHPDIEAFIRIKNDRARRKVQYANVSVLITHEFMDAVKHDRDFDLRWGGKTFKTVRARDLWTLIIENAHASAEPGIIFWDTMREHHNVEYAHPITSTNPCVTGDTLVYTAEGLFPIAELAESGRAAAVTLDGRFGAGPWGPASVPFKTGMRDVYRLTTREGFEVRVTKDHRFMTDRGWVAASDLVQGDRLHVLNRKGGFGNEGTAREGRVLGWLIADGHIKSNKDRRAVLGFWGRERELAESFAEDVNQIIGQEPDSSRYRVGVIHVESRNEARVSSARLATLVEERYGVTAETKTDGLPLAALRASEEFQRGFLQAMFTADGTINGQPPRSGVNVRLTSVSLPLLRDVQRMLLNFGIVSRLYRDRHPVRQTVIRGRTYSCQAVHELIVSRSNVLRFEHEINFLTVAKRTLLQHLLGRYDHARPYRERFRVRFESLVSEGKEVVYDLTEPVSNSFCANGLVVHNCGEQALASYTACNLGSLNLSRFVDSSGAFDFDEFACAARLGTRFLDDVIEYNMPNHALDKIKDAVAADRRVGLGITGLGDALVKMRIRYDTDRALRIVDRIMETLTTNAYAASIELAKEKGSFPLFRWTGDDGDPAGGVAGSKFVQALPTQIREAIRRHGLRNSTVITVPPVGTGSIVAQTSSGIEPIFCTSYKRRVKNPDGETFTEYKVFHPLIRELFGGDESLPDHVVTAHEIDPYFRVRMQGVIQRWVDSSISSTVNLAEDVSVETVADIYVTAYEAGLKGITVYREGSREGILQTEKKPAVAAAANGNGHGAPGADSAAVTSEGLVPRHRPRETRGRTVRMKTGEGNLYVTINEDEKGLCEVFTSIGKAGGNAAAQSEAISRLISLCLRSGVDPLEIVKQLKGIAGSTPFWDEGELILSTPDAIGRALERYLHERRAGQGELPLPPAVAPFPASSVTAAPAPDGPPSPAKGGNGSSVASNRVEALVGSAGGARTGGTTGTNGGAHDYRIGEPAGRSADACPECGVTVVHAESCLKCNNCGWSRC